MFKLEYKNKSLDLTVTGAQSEFRFGIMTEFNVSDPAKSLKKEFTFSKLLIIDGEEFYLSTGDGFSVKDYSGTNIPLKDFDSSIGDEERMDALLTCILPSFDSTRKDYDIKVINFNIITASDYCSDCLTNKGCKLNFCKSYCNWDAGYKCCSNEKGSSCS